MNNGTENLAAGIRILIEPALARPADLMIRVARTGAFYAVTATVHPGDMPRLIGTAGNNIKALKAILQHVGDRNDVTIRLTAVDPPRASSERFATTPSRNWRHRPLIDCAQAALRMARYSDALVGPQEMAEKFFLTCPTPLHAEFADGLARWLHVVGRALGGNVVFVNERAATV